jgi:hypothetical protein
MGVTTDPIIPSVDAEPPPDPWPLVKAGLAAGGFAWVLSWFPGSLFILLGVLAGGGALLAMGVAASRSYQSWRVLLCAALAVFAVYISLDYDWDSIRLAVGVLLLVTLVGSGLAALPQRRRRAVLSFLVLVHFGAVLTAVLAAPNPPWFTEQLRAHFYQPYLEFMHLTETYKWFAPEPGPEPILWFRVEYADKSHRWVKVREPDDFSTKLIWTRFGSLTTWAIEPVPDGENLTESIIRRRISAGKHHHPPIPLDEDDDVSSQYQEPLPISKVMLASYARYVARTYPHPTDPDQSVTGVKIYGVVRSALDPDEFSRGTDPYDPTLLTPFYLGDYDPVGKINPECFRVTYNRYGRVIKRTQNAFLYWVLAIEREKDGSLTNYVKIHAGDMGEDEP